MTTKREEALLALGEQVVTAAQKGGATTAEVTVREGSHLSTTVRMRETELLEEAGSRALGLRVMIGQQVAVSYTSDLSDQGVARLVEDALELAQLSEPDPFAGAPDPALLSTRDEHQDFDLFDEEMGALGAGEALARAKEAEAAALDYDPRITNSDGASFSRAAGGGVLVTSGGFRGATRGTYASLSVVPMAKESDGKNRRGHYWTAKRHLAELESAKDVGVTAAQRTLRKLGAKKVATQEAPVIFNEDTARSILGLLAGCVNGSAIWRKSSYLLDREGERIASDLISIVDDPLIPKAPGSRPYDGEGLLSRKNVVVENGVLKTFLMDSYSARKLEKESTASASRGSSGGVGPSTSNFILAAGDITHDELVGSTKSGLYVTEMMGFGFNAVTGDFSRGAAGFWVENGELAYPVSEVTISLNLDDLLKRIDAVADDLDLRTSIASPSFRVSAMTIAGS